MKILLLIILLAARLINIGSEILTVLKHETSNLQRQKKLAILLPSRGGPMIAVMPLTIQISPNPFVSFSSPTSLTITTGAREINVAEIK